ISLIISLSAILYLKRLPLGNGSQQIAITAAIIEQWFAVTNHRRFDLAYENGMVAAFISGNDATFQTGERIVRQWRAFDALFISNARETIRVFGSKAARQGFLLLIEDVNREKSAFRKGVVNGRLVVNADENERRVKRQRTKGANRQPAILPI